MPDVSITDFSANDGKFNKASRDMSQFEADKTTSPFLDPNVYREPAYFVYVYSVVDPRPANHKLVRHLPPLIPRLEIRECGPSDKWVLVTTIPHPINQQEIDTVSGERKASFHRAERAAMDIVNPSNRSLDQDAKDQIGAMSAIGDNYGNLGVFWSKNYPPTEAEINKAIARKESFYRDRTQQANNLQISNPKALQDWLTPTDHIAADYLNLHFGMEFSWHQVPKRLVSCPNCGEQIKSLDIAFHPSAAFGGKACILDWKKAVDAGVVAKADVPEGKRWWGKAKELHEEVRA